MNLVASIRRQLCKYFITIRSKTTVPAKLSYTKPRDKIYNQIYYYNYRTLDRILYLAHNTAATCGRATTYNIIERHRSRARLRAENRIGTIKYCKRTSVCGER